MYFGKYGAIAVRSPRSAFRALCLLAAPYKSDIAPRQLNRLVRKRFAHLSPDIAPAEFPRVSSLKIREISYYLRLYRTHSLLDAARYLWACRTAPGVGIDVPDAQQTCITYAAGRICLALLEEKILGEEMWNTEWTPSLAKDLATDLARWHAIPEMYYGPYEPLFVPCRTIHYRKRLSRPHLSGREPTPEQHALVDYAKGLLNRAELFGNVRISHGDISPHNLIARHDGHIAWIDLDRISLRPVWHDLATVMCKLMPQDAPAAVNAFEQTYFQLAPQLYQQWLAVRLQWFALRNVLEGVKWLTIDRKSRLGSNIAPENDPLPLQWAQTFFAQATAAISLTDTGQDSGEMIAQIHSRTPQHDLVAKAS